MHSPRKKTERVSPREREIQSEGEAERGGKWPRIGCNDLPLEANKESARQGGLSGLAEVWKVNPSPQRKTREREGRACKG